MVGLLGLSDEGNSYFVKFYCFNNFTAMNIHLTVRYLQLKKDSPHISPKEVVFEASRK